MMYFVCFFMILCSIRHFWLGSRCIQEKSFTIQERWILSQHSDTIFRSPTFLASEIYTFVSCHYDVFCVFFHDIVLDSSFLTGFTLYTRKILHYTRKMNPFPTFWHNFQISNIPSFWDIHVCILSLRCILCVFSWYCTRFVIFDWVHVVYKKNPSLYMKDESFPTFWHNFQISNMPSFWDIYVCIPVTTMYFVCFFMLLCSIRHFWLGSSCIQEKSFTIQERWILSQHSDTIFRSPTCLASEIYTFVTCHYDVFCVFFHVIVLDSSFLTGFQLYTRKILLRYIRIQETRFVIFDWVPLYTRKILHYTWKMNPFQHFDTIFRSPTCLASEIYTFVSCHYDVFCVFFHDIVLDSSFLTGFTLYTRKILHYTRKMNPFPTFWHNFQISNMPSFWDIHVCILSLRCILCVFSWYCTRFVIFDWVPVVYKKNPSLYKKDESFPNILTQFSDLQHA